MITAPCYISLIMLHNETKNRELAIAKGIGLTQLTAFLHSQGGDQG